MEIMKHFSDYYQVTDRKGNAIRSFYDLKTAALVKRYLAGDHLEEEEINHAIGAIEMYDEEMKRRDEERAAMKEVAREKARLRKAAKEAANQQEEECKGGDA